jgi:signal transduction histidine kinase
LKLELNNRIASNISWKIVLLLAISTVVLTGCRKPPTNAGPYIKFDRVPPADEGGPDKLDVIEGEVIGDHTNLQIVLFARSRDWYVQPLSDQTFTQIQPDSRWRSTTHLGTEYAALLVEPGYQPPTVTATLPGAGGGVVAVASVKGEPVFWQRWWFLLLCLLASLPALLVFYNYRLMQSSRQLNLRFEERLAERTRVAEELHDTLLQGVISASMQLNIAVDRLPEDLTAKPSLVHVLQVMGKVVAEGNEALQRLRSSAKSDALNIEQAFSQIKQEFAVEKKIDFQVSVKGQPKPVHPIIRDEIYRFGREMVLNAFRHTHTRRINLEVEYHTKQLRVVIRSNGGSNEPQVLRSGRDDLYGVSGMRRRAQGIGARLRVRSRADIGTEVELSVPGHVAFPNQPSYRSWLNWLARWNLRNARPEATRTTKGGKNHE